MSANHDGIRGMLPRDEMSPGIRKYWDFFNQVPGAPIYQQEFGYYSLEKWRREEGLPADADLRKEFGFDEQAVCMLGELGGCEAAFDPPFEVEVLEDRGDYELVRDHAGRHVLYFKNRRNGFMPEYVDHPVKDMKSWQEMCKWRMDSNAPGRMERIKKSLIGAVESARRGMLVEQYMVGGYMYLRSLIGPTELLYKFYDEPELIEDCMEAWFRLADAVMEIHQQAVCIDEILLDEDICYNHGSLISPDMIRRFLLPYYQQLMENAKRRQLDPARAVRVHVGSDGFFDGLIPLYQSFGMNYLSPFEVASGSDVVRTGRQYPTLLISGGIDKRVLAQGKEAIDREIDRILPVMQARGGYIPTCDHGVPEEVSLENYRYFRKRLLEFA